MRGAAYLKKEIGVFLRTMRTRNKQTLPAIAAQLGFDSINFLSRIEKGDATIPAERIASLARAYQIDPAMFARITLAVHHPEIYDLFRWIIRTDSNLCSHAASLHKSKQETKKKHDEWLNSTMLRESLDTMRTLMLENEQYAPKPGWKKKGYFVDPAIDLEKTGDK